MSVRHLALAYRVCWLLLLGCALAVATTNVSRRVRVPFTASPVPGESGRWTFELEVPARFARDVRPGARLHLTDRLGCIDAPSRLTGWEHDRGTERAGRGRGTIEGSCSASRTDGEAELDLSSEPTLFLLFPLLEGVLPGTGVGR